MTPDRLTRLDDARDRARIALEDARSRLLGVADRARLRSANVLRGAAYMLDADIVTMSRDTFGRWRSTVDDADNLIDAIRAETVSTGSIVDEIRRLKSLDR